MKQWILQPSTRVAWRWELGREVDSDGEQIYMYMVATYQLHIIVAKYLRIILLHFINSLLYFIMFAFQGDIILRQNYCIVFYREVWVDHGLKKTFYFKECC